MQPITLSESQAASLVMAIDAYHTTLHNNAQQAEKPEQRQWRAAVERDLTQVRDELCDELLYQLGHPFDYPPVP
jgi:hypothetical protein